MRARAIATGAALVIACAAAAAPIGALAGAEVLSVSPTSAAPGDQVTVRGHGFGALNVNVTVCGSAAGVDLATGNTVVFTMPAIEPGPCTVLVSNPGGAVAAAVSVLVLPPPFNNQPPRIDSLTVTDSTPEVLTTISMTVTAHDPDPGETATLAYAWAVSSAPGGSSAGFVSPTNPTTNFTPDVAGTYQLSITVTDIHGASASFTFSIQGVPQVDVSIVVTPRGPNVWGLEAQASGGDPVATPEYQWLIVAPLGAPPPPGSFSSPNANATDFTAGALGTYDVRVIVTVGDHTRSADVTLVVTSLP